MSQLAPLHPSVKRLGRKVVAVAAAVALMSSGAILTLSPSAVAATAPGTILPFADSTGNGGFAGDGGPALSALLNAPQGLIFDTSGNAIIADTNNSRIRVVAASTGSFYGVSMTAGDIYTIAGNGTAGYSGNGGPALSAEFRYPQGVAIDAAGNLVIANTNNNAVRIFATTTGTFYGQAMTAGDLYTVAGTTASSFSGDGGPALNATFSDLQSAIPDSAGNLLIADANNDRIRVIAEATSTFYGVKMTDGDVYTIAGNGGSSFSSSGVAATASGIGNPNMVEQDAAGNLVLNGYLDQRMLVVAETTGTFYNVSMKAGDIYSIAGNGQVGSVNGAAASAEFCYPNTFVIDHYGNIIIADLFNNEIRVLAEATGTFYGMAMTKNHVYTLAGSPTRYESSGDNGPSTAAGLDEPGTVALDAAGDIYEAEMDEPNPPSAPVVGTQGSSRIREITASTAPLNAPGVPGTPTATPGNAQAALTWTAPTTGGAPSDYLINQYAGTTATGTPTTIDTHATTLSATVTNLTNGNPYTFTITATNTTGPSPASGAATTTPTGATVPAGTISTLAGTGTAGYSGDGAGSSSAMLSNPRSTATDAAGDVFVADSGNNRVRVIAATTGSLFGISVVAGDIYTVAGNGTAGSSGDGGLATAANLNAPHGVAVDASGDLLIADSGSNRIRVVAATSGTHYGIAMAAGDIYTIAGTGSASYSGNAGPGTSAALNYPTGIAVDGQGDVVIADYGNDRVRVLAETTGTSWGTAMTAGDIYVVAGSGTYGYSGDKGKGTSAALANPNGVAVDKSGNLIIADYDNSRVRMLADTTGTFYGIAATVGDIYTIAGNGTYGFSGDGSTATSAEFSDISGVAVDANGNVLIADLWNDEIRALAETTGTYYGISMTAGKLYDIAGDGNSADTGNGGQATSAAINDPAGITVGPGGNLYIAERSGNMVRLVTE